MDDVMTVNGLQSVNETSAEELRLLLGESSLPGQVVSQVTAQKKVHHEVQVLRILEGVVSVNYELRVYHRK